MPSPSQTRLHLTLQQSLSNFSVHTDHHKYYILTKAVILKVPYLLKFWMHLVFTNHAPLLHKMIGKLIFHMSCMLIEHHSTLKQEFHHFCCYTIDTQHHVNLQHSWDMTHYLTQHTSKPDLQNFRISGSSFTKVPL